jgi:prepilin-type processing-associated H-X9-DG protein
MHPLSLRILLVLSCMLSSFICGRGSAQDREPSSLVPAQTLASVTLWPKRLAESPSLKMAPLEVITAACLENIGLDPLKLERVDILIGVPSLTGQLNLGAIVNSSVPIDLSALNPDLLDSGELIDDKGFKYLLTDTPIPDVIIHPLSDKVALVGTMNFTKNMVNNAAPNNEVATVLAGIKSAQDALAVVSINSLRPLLEGFVESAPLDRGLLIQVNELINSTSFIALRLMISTEEKIQLVVSANDEAAAERVEIAVAYLLKFAAEQAIAQVESEVQQDSMTGQAMVAYAKRVSAEILDRLRPTKSGRRLVYEVKDFQNVNLVATLTGLLLPAVQSARFSARKMQSMNNLKQLGLAMHNFESAYRMLPATGGIGDDGQPMLSWRVAILPFIGEQALYNEFNLDEPWDSEHNLALLERMPAVFQHPNRVTLPGYTVYQAPVNDQTLLRADEPSRFAQITDGTSNTIMLVEVDEQLAVPWTAPQDYELDMANPSAGLFVNGVMNVLFGDGSVRELNEAATDLDVLRALFTRAGGEVVRLP